MALEATQNFYWPLGTGPVLSYGGRARESTSDLIIVRSEPGSQGRTHKSSLIAQRGWGSWSWSFFQSGNPFRKSGIFILWYNIFTLFLHYDTIYLHQDIPEYTQARPARACVMSWHKRQRNLGRIRMRRILIWMGRLLTDRSIHAG